MKDILITALGCLLAVCLVVLLLIPPSNKDLDRPSLPTSADPGPYGLLGLTRWLGEAGVTTASLRRRYDQLFSPSLWPATGNLLVLSLPQRYPARDRERKDLVDWVEQGNSLLILAAANDAPQWSWVGRAGGVAVRQVMLEEQRICLDKFQGG